MLAGLLGILWLVAVGCSALMLQHEIGEVYDGALQETAQRLVPLVGPTLEYGSGPPSAANEPKAPDAGEYEEFLIYQVRDRTGRVLVRSNDAPVEAFAAPLEIGFSTTDGWRVYTQPASSGRFYVQVTEPPTHRAEALASAFAWFALPLLLIVPLAVLGIHRSIARSTRPIAAVREQIHRRSGLNLDPICEDGLPDELTPLVVDVNLLFGRLSHALEGERAFASNSAHELRTPVAAALAQTQRLTALLEGSALQRRAERVGLLLEQLGNIVEKLLQLSRAEAGIGLGRECLDLMPALKLILDDYSRRSEPAGRLQLDDRGIQELWGQMDIEAFAIAVRNLIDNALVHGPAGEPIEISIDSPLALSIRNGGPPVPREILPTLTQRFVRGRSSRSGGAGLGLSIASTILIQSGGVLELHSPAAGRSDGFQAVMRLARSVGPHLPHR